MLDFHQAWSKHVESAPLLAEVETRQLADALNFIAAETIQSPIHVPGQRLSAMDGYALAAVDFAPGKTYGISQRIAAGEFAKPLIPGTVVRIFTGAPVPDKADVVIPQELVEEKDGGVVFHLNEVKPQQHIRQIGENLAQGDLVVAQGQRLKSQTLGLLASIGVAQLKVYRPLKVVTFTTGDELVMPGRRLGPNQIYNSNLFVLKGLLKKLGAEVIDMGQVADTLEETQEALARAALLGDIIVTTGGVSVGEEDHIKPAVEALGHLDLWKVRMKPGKPMACGEVKGVPFIGLPGNPVASFVAFHLFTNFYIRKANGEQVAFPEPIWAQAAFSRDKTHPSMDFPRARLVNKQGRTWVELFPNQGSAALNSVQWAEGVVTIEPGTTIAKGDYMPFYPFERLLPL